MILNSDLPALSGIPDGLEALGMPPANPPSPAPSMGAWLFGDSSDGPLGSDEFLEESDEWDEMEPDDLDDSEPADC